LSCFFYLVKYTLSGNYNPPQPALKLGDFLHDSHVTREVAKQILETFKHENGYFLVRRTQRDENILVLSLMYNCEFFNYEICAKELPLANKYYFIDDGPYFKSLTNLIEHYTKYEDGLPGILTKSIHPSSIMNNSNSSQRQQQKQQQPFASAALGISASSSTASGSFNHMQPHHNNHPQLNSNGSGSSGDTLSHSKSDALTRANLFKSRTLLNDQSKKVSLE
jgi:hypothetical protein